MTGQAPPAGSNPSVQNGPFAQTQTFAQQISGAPTPQSPAEQLHTVTVDGQQIQVPYQELLNGYAARQKMTAATQEAAALKLQLQELDTFKANLERDPQRIIDEIRARYPDKTTAGTANAGNNPDDDFEDPMSAEVEQLKAELVSLRNQTASSAQQQRLELDIQRLSQTYGDQFDRTEVLAFATSRGLDNLEDAYKLMQYEKGQSAPAAEGQAATAVENPAQILARAEQGSQALAGVAPGSTPQPGAEPPAIPALPGTPEEAFRMALSDHGLDADSILPS